MYTAGSIPASGRGCPAPGGGAFAARFGSRDAVKPSTRIGRRAPQHSSFARRCANLRAGRRRIGADVDAFSQGPERIRIEKSRFRNPARARCVCACSCVPCIHRIFSRCAALTIGPSSASSGTRGTGTKIAESSSIPDGRMNAPRRLTHWASRASASSINADRASPGVPFWSPRNYRTSRRRFTCPTRSPPSRWCRKCSRSRGTVGYWSPQPGQRLARAWYASENGSASVRFVWSGPARTALNS